MSFLDMQVMYFAQPRRGVICVARGETPGIKNKFKAALQGRNNIPHKRVPQ
jgi:hypothetical protein